MKANCPIIAMMGSMASTVVILSTTSMMLLHAAFTTNPQTFFSNTSKATLSSSFSSSSPLVVRTPAQTTELRLAKKKKMSFAQKKKQRSQKQQRRLEDDANNPNTSSSSPGPRPDQWDPIAPTTTIVATAEEKQKAQTDAATLIDSQRRSVAMLTHVKERVEALDISNVRERLGEGGSSSGDGDHSYYYYVVDDFLADAAIVSELQTEGRSLLEADKLSVLKIGSGEYGAPLTGGDEYAASPRSVEYVVSITRHLTTLFNNIDSSKENKNNNMEQPPPIKLDATASMGSIMVFDRKAKLAVSQMVEYEQQKQQQQQQQQPSANTTTDEENKPFVTITEDNTEDMRKVTTIYFTTDEGWGNDDANNCGGGIEIQTHDNEEAGGAVVKVEARRDRLVLIRSDKCRHRREEWKGNDDMENGGCLVVHLCRER